MARVRQSVGQAMGEVEAAASDIRRLIADLEAGRLRFLFTVSRSSDGKRIGVGVEMQRVLNQDPPILAAPEPETPA